MPEQKITSSGADGSATSIKYLRSIILHEPHREHVGHYTCLINCNKYEDIWYLYDDTRKDNKFVKVGDFKDITSKEKDYMKRCID